MPGQKIAHVSSGYTQQFLQNPLLFMRTHAMSPPNDSGWAGDLGTSTAPAVAPTAAQGAPSSWKAATPSQMKPAWNAAKPSAGVVAASQARLNAALNKYHKPDRDVERRSGAGGIRYVQIVDHPSPNFAGATTFKFLRETETRVGSWMPIYWLPWKSLKILEYTIPGVPHSLAEWDDEEYPRFFFTAGINGCSVFAHGSPQNPTVSHAGFDGSLGRPAGEFWRSQMAKTKSGYSTAAIRGEVNSHMYALNSVQAKALAEEYRQFLSGNGTAKFELEVQSPYGCVFGIRYGRAWTLYLQKSVLYEKVTFHKGNEVETRDVNGDDRTFLRGTNTLLKEEKSRSLISPKKVGPFKTGIRVDNVYSRKSYFSMPLQITEMFPNTGYVADLKDVFKRR